MGRSKLSQEKRDKIKELYPLVQRGEINMKQAAEIVGCGHSTFRSYTVVPERHGSVKDYMKRLAKSNGHKSISAQQKANTERRQKTPQNQSLSELINDGLDELDISGAELGRRIDISRALMSRYKQGKTMPPQDTFQKICQVFSTPYLKLPLPLRGYYKGFSL